MYVFIITVAERVMGAETTAAGTKDSMEVIAVTGMRAWVKGTLQTPPIPNTYRCSSVETRHIVTEVDQSDIREGGLYLGVCMYSCIGLRPQI